MGNWLKPISRRNARIAAVVIGLLLISGIISFIKELLSGIPFDEIRSSAIMLLFGVIIEYAMITISFSKEETAEETKKAEPGTTAEDQDLQAPEDPELKALEEKYK